MADPVDRVRMIILGRDMSAKKALNTKPARNRLSFTVKSATPRLVETYSGDVGKRVRTRTPVVDVKLTGDFDIEICGMTQKEAKAFRIGAECTIEVLR
jgi:hypothetical protein